MNSSGGSKMCFQFQNKYKFNYKHSYSGLLIILGKQFFSIGRFLHGTTCPGKMLQLAPAWNLAHKINLKKKRNWYRHNIYTQFEPKHSCI